MAPGTPGLVHYLPILTTIISACFAVVLVRRYRSRGGTHHLWWTAGVGFYGLGTAIESAITLFGNTVLLTKVWYIAGALLGGYPLAQGSVYFHLRRRTAHILSAITLPFIAVVSVLVLLSPANVAALEPHRPGGAVLGWSWIRLFTPFINSYAAFFLIGTAIRSSWRAIRNHTSANLAIGNALIAIGAILPGIGGGMAKAGVVEALYIGEFVGIILIWIGYSYCVRRSLKEPAVSAQPART
jgi:hypothetical protein